MGFLKHTKTWAAQAAAKNHLNRQFAAVGTITELELDADAKTIRLRVELKGETQPLVVLVKAYRLIETNAQWYVEVSEAELSREWMQGLFDQFGKGTRFAVPEMVRHFL